MTIYTIPPLLTLFCFAALLALAAIRRPTSRIGMLFALMCVMGISLNLDILYGMLGSSPERALRISRLTHLVLVFAIPVYIQFFHIYLNIQNRRWLVRLAYLYAIVLAPISQSVLYLETVELHFFGMFARGGVLYPLFGIGGLGVTIYVLAIVHRAAARNTHVVQKTRLHYVLAGFGWMGLLHGLNVLPRLGAPIYPPSTISFIPLAVFAIGLFRYDLLDMGMLIQKGVLYSLLTTALTCLYACIVTLADRLLTGMTFSESIHLPLLLFLVVALVFSPFKDRIQRLIDRTFFHHRLEYRKALGDISRTIVSLLNPEDIGQRITQALADRMHLQGAAMIIRTDNGSGFQQLAAVGKRPHIPSDRHDPIRRLLLQVEHHPKPVLRQHLGTYDHAHESTEMLSDMDRVGADVLVPLRCRKEATGFLLLGEKRSGALYFSGDIDLLETLAGQTALALENEKNFRKAESLSQDLERRIEERTCQLEKALEEKEQTQAQLIQSESLAAIGQLVAGTAHELNNPLASVKSLLQSTIEDLDSAVPEDGIDDMILDDLRFADRELSRAREIVNSLLGLSRQRQNYAEKIQINGVIQDALRILRSQHKHRKPDIVKTLASNLPVIEGNFANLGQVAINLIQNAIQATADRDGRIFLSTRYEAAAREIVFECADTGPGIPEIRRQDVFKPFFTTKPVGRGTGLGLYICHEIIRKHQGSLALANPGEAGARFVVRLPVAR